MKKLLTLTLCALIAALTVTSCTVEKPEPEPGKTVIVTKYKSNVKLDEGLVVHYTFDSETTDSVIDSSGRNNHGTTISGKSIPLIDRTKAKVGSGAGQFDFGKVVLVDLKDDLNFKKSTDKDGLSFSLWFYKNEYNTDAHQLILNTQDISMTNGESAFYLCVDSRPHENRAGYITFNRYGTDFGQQSAQSPLVPNSWNHIVVVKNRKAWQIYVNGSLLRETLYLSGDFYPGKFVIGHGNNNGAFGGFVDDFRLYERALNIYEIKALSEQ